MKLGFVGRALSVLAVGALLFAISTPQPAAALPAYAAATKKACGSCHVNSAGGGPRNSFGEAFAANGHKLPGRK